ncbi:hypothetical protein [Arthrobacter sunyaminii]|uniref:hypothetical protein n=1 Tax=Arthrobacter sunyaminii TaxID=2816859 RepID=UPI001A94AF9D|nr:hypothetical protein [Arthrobacter sunyaminii]MBO0895683.1 hypothetical protein [Arthrobacter sunyaminii]
MSSVAGDTQGGSDGRNQGTSQGRVEGRRFSAVTALVVSGLVALGLLAGTVLLLRVIGSGSPEASLSLVFVCAVVVLILVVCTLAIVLRRLGLTDRTEAMGLPSGTIRAVISLLLIMLFFIAAIFLFNSTQAKTDVSETRSLQGISAEMFFRIPVDQIQGSVLNESEGNVSYDVVLYQPPSGTATSDDLAKQLITTVGTLVTAVAAFYFGANSVKSARSDGGVSAKDDDTPDNPDATTAPAEPSTTPQAELSPQTPQTVVASRHISRSRRPNPPTRRRPNQRHTSTALAEPSPIPAKIPGDPKTSTSWWKRLFSH